ncbi:hypothetical protein ACV35N_34255, partial [Pseudomonas aeruginosa]
MTLYGTAVKAGIGTELDLPPGPVGRLQGCQGLFPNLPRPLVNPSFDGDLPRPAEAGFDGQASTADSGHRQGNDPAP